MTSKCEFFLGKAGDAILVVTAWVATSAAIGAIGSFLWDFFWYGAVVLVCTAPLSGAWHFAAWFRTGKRILLKEYLYFLLIFHACLLAAGFLTGEDFPDWAWEITWRMGILYGIMALQSLLVDHLLNRCEARLDGRR